MFVAVREGFQRDDGSNEAVGSSSLVAPSNNSPGAYDLNLPVLLQRAVRRVRGLDNGQVSLASTSSATTTSTTAAATTTTTL